MGGRDGEFEYAGLPSEPAGIGPCIYRSWVVYEGAVDRADGVYWCSSCVLELAGVPNGSDPPYCVNPLSPYGRYG